MSRLLNAIFILIGVPLAAALIVAAVAAACVLLSAVIIVVVVVLAALVVVATPIAAGIGWYSDVSFNQYIKKVRKDNDAARKHFAPANP